MELKKEIEELTPRLIEMRRDFHRHPELGRREYRTSGIIEDELKRLGMETRRCHGTGVIGLLRGGKPGKTLCLRSDIDALPVREETGLPFASENEGVMHACGHDGHISCLLTTAAIMSRHKDEIPGNILFLFQTNEEDAGAQAMIDEDFVEFLNVVPGAFFFMGVGDHAKGTDYEHHNNHFNIDEDVLPKAVEMQCVLTRKYLGF